jgi:hypothetical protein
MIQDEFLISRSGFLLALEILGTCFGLVDEFGLHVSEDDLQRVARIMNVLLKSMLNHIDTSEPSAVCPDPLLEAFSDIFNVFELLVLDHLVEGQEALFLWADLFRSSSQHPSGSESVSLHVPSSALEVSTGADVSSTLTTNESSALSIFSFKARVYGRCAVQFISNPIHVVLDFRVGSQGQASNSKATIHIPNLARQDYPLPGKQTGLRTDCVAGDHRSFNFTCVIAPTENFTITHQCHGLPERLSTECPSVIIAPQCQIIAGSDEYFLCGVERYDLLSTVCSCKVNRNVPRNSTRRLGSANTYNLRLVTTTGTIVEEARVETAVIKVDVAVEGSFASLLSLLVVFAVASSRLLYSVRSDYSSDEDKKLRKVLNDGHSRSSSSGADTVVSADVAANTDKASKGQAAHDLTIYLMATMPFLYQPSTSQLEGYYHEVCRHHCYLTATPDSQRTLVHGSGGETRHHVQTSRNTLRISKNIVVQMFVLFLLALIYGYQVNYYLKIYHV